MKDFEIKGVLKGMEPERPNYWFEVISGIVRGSSHEKPMSDFLVEFAKERGYEVRQDERYNVFMKVPGCCGGENAKPILMHVHMDMVWNTAEGVEHDFWNEPLDLYLEEDGDTLRARGTTLGADNGIGVAYVLSLIENQDIPHPPFECAFAVMEEMGKKGLEVFDYNQVTAKRMIDINWIDDKQIVVGVGGDVSEKITVPADWEKAPEGYCPFLVQIKGAKGGHCEWEIHQERSNAMILMGRLLAKIMEVGDVRLACIEGGVQNNVIPRYTNAVILVAPADKDAVCAKIEEIGKEFKAEFEVSDPDVNVEVAAADYPEKVMPAVKGKKFAQMLHILPNSLLNINVKVPKAAPFSEVMASSGGFPMETDANLGILRTEGDEIWMITTITSALTSRKHDVVDKIKQIVELADIGATVEQFGVDAYEFPWNPDSEMAAIASRVYKEVYNEDPIIEVNCCSLELGMLVMNCGLDCVCLGVASGGNHSADEWMSIKSFAAQYNYLKKLLEVLCKE